MGVTNGQRDIKGGDLETRDLCLLAGLSFVFSCLHHACLPHCLPREPSLAPCATQLTQMTYYCPSSPKSWAGAHVCRGPSWCPQGPSWYLCILSTFQETGLLPCVESGEPLPSASLKWSYPSAGEGRLSPCSGAWESTELSRQSIPGLERLKASVWFSGFPVSPVAGTFKPPCFPKDRAAGDSCVLAMTKDV